MRTVWIGVLSLIGGFSLSQGAALGASDLIIVGLLALCLAFGIILQGHVATTFMRNHSKAIWRAGLIRYFFRRF